MYIFDALSFQEDLGPKGTIVTAADYLAGMTHPHGPIRERFDSEIYWKDSYLALVVMSLMAGRSYPKLKPLVMSSLKWLGEAQTPEGKWWGSYLWHEGEFVNGQELSQSTDWGQCSPLVALALYYTFFKDPGFVCPLADKFLLGLDSFIQDNYNPDLQLYHSHLVGTPKFLPGDGEIPTGVDWAPSGTYTALGQIITYMGLQSAWALTGTPKYKFMAQQLFQAFSTHFYSKELGFYKTSLTNNTTYDLVSTALAMWVFGPTLPHAQEVTSKALGWRTINGTVIVPPSPLPLARNNAALALLLMAVGAYDTERAQLYPHIRECQLLTYPNPLYGDGGIQDEPGVPYIPVFSTALALLALTEEPSSILWWP